MYNGIMELKERFRLWINARYKEFRGDGLGQEVSVSRYAEHVGVNQRIMDDWLKGKKAPRDRETVSKLVSLYGLEALVVLEYIVPSDILDPVTRQFLDEVGLLSVEE